MPRAFKPKKRLVALIVKVYCQLFNQTSCFQRFVGTALFDGFKGLGRDVNRDFFVDFRHENGLFLNIHLATAIACGVEFGRADTVRIPASNARSLAGYCADA